MFRERPGCRVTPDSLLVIWCRGNSGGLVVEVAVNIRRDIQLCRERRLRLEGEKHPRFVSRVHGVSLHSWEALWTSAAPNCIQTIWNLHFPAWKRLISYAL